MTLSFWRGHNVKQMKNTYRAITGGVLFTLGFALLLIAREFEGVADWYSETIYAVIARISGGTIGRLAFSVIELLLYLLVIWFLIAAGHVIYKLIWKKERSVVPRFFSACFLGAGMLFFLYSVNCGVNYERSSFTETSGIGLVDYSVEDLKEVCLWLTERLSKSSTEVTRNEDGVMVLGDNEKEAASLEMEALGEKYPELSGDYPLPKGFLSSSILSIQNLTGIYLPFTVEANYNKDIVAYNIPFTMCHELSHLRGFMQEQEANFIGWLACSESERADFQYSADLMGWTYCMNLLAKIDPEAYTEVRRQLSERVEIDLQANSQFWKKYDTRIAEVSNKVNDTYLKANGQVEGVASYDRMVDLLVAYYLNING